MKTRILRRSFPTCVAAERSVSFAFGMRASHIRRRRTSEGVILLIVLALTGSAAVLSAAAFDAFRLQVTSAASYLHMTQQFHAAEAVLRHCERVSVAGYRVPKPGNPEKPRTDGQTIGNAAPHGNDGNDGGSGGAHGDRSGESASSASAMARLVEAARAQGESSGWRAREWGAYPRVDEGADMMRLEAADARDAHGMTARARRVVMAPGGKVLGECLVERWYAEQGVGTAFLVTARTVRTRGSFDSGTWLQSLWWVTAYGSRREWRQIAEPESIP